MFDKGDIVVRTEPTSVKVGTVGLVVSPLLHSFYHRILVNDENTNEIIVQVWRAENFVKIKDYV